MCSVTAVGVEELVDERLLQGEQPLIDWQAATRVVGESEVESNEAKVGWTDKKDSALMGVSLDEWTDALQALGELGDAPEAAQAGLDPTFLSTLKHRIRSLDVGTLLTIRAFRQYGHQRLAEELRELNASELLVGWVVISSTEYCHLRSLHTPWVLSGPMLLLSLTNCRMR